MTELDDNHGPAYAEPRSIESGPLVGHGRWDNRMEKTPYRMILNLTDRQVHLVEMAVRGERTLAGNSRPEIVTEWQELLDAIANGAVEQTMDEFHACAIEVDDVHGEEG